MNILDSVVFYTRDISAITDFYTEKIGLRLEEGSSDKYVSFLFDNGVHLGIKKAAEPREVPGSQTFFLGVEDAEAAYHEAQAKGLHIHKPLTKEPWAIEFSVLDPDGNKVEYLQKTA